jgi:hypothetical protein
MDIIVVFALKIISKPNLGGPIHNGGIRCMETSSFELSKCAKLPRSGTWFICLRTRSNLLNSSNSCVYVVNHTVTIGIFLQLHKVFLRDYTHIKLLSYFTNCFFGCVVVPLQVLLDPRRFFKRHIMESKQNLQKK